MMVVPSPRRKIAVVAAEHDGGVMALAARGYCKRHKIALFGCTLQYVSIRGLHTHVKFRQCDIARFGDEHELGAEAATWH